MRALTTDLERADLRPYFLWDEDVSIAELREALAHGDPYTRDRLLGKMLREARDIDVWRFVTPIQVADALPRVERRLGRRAAFWRFLIDGWCDDGLERVHQVCADKPVHEGVAVDPPEEILANKLCAIVGRLEERDLVDVMALERAGYRVEDALAHALAKDGGCTPANLAWLLSEMRIPDDVVLPGGVLGRELGAFVRDLVVRLRRIAMPSAP